MVGGFNSNSNIDNPQPKTLSPETPRPNSNQVLRSSSLKLDQ